MFCFLWSWVGVKMGSGFHWSFSFALSSCWLGSAFAAWAFLVSQIIKSLSAMQETWA